ncbi:uncharacterized protein [Primulina eburnea]|uniref:uncharacterized protein n=1 Tax=Primulina eburnea TaxID=1245227 RepID=UPI003C6CC289
MRLQEVFCDKCGGEHFSKEFQDSDPFYVQYEAQVGIQNHPRNYPYLNSYNPGWRQHPNFSWGGQNSQNRPQRGKNCGQQPMYRPEPREEKSSLEQMMPKFISSAKTRLQNMEASIKGLENHIWQLAKMIASRDPDTFSSNTETNPKEQLKAIALRNGKVIEQEGKETGKQREEAADTSTSKSSNSTQASTTQSRIVIPPVFPTALEKTKMDAQFGKFLEVFKKLNINIPFVDALMQMPIYAKFLKDISVNKKKLEDHMTPYVILVQVLTLMPLSMFKKLDLGETKTTRMSLQLSDISVRYPQGFIEDVLVKVDKFIFSVDFVVLDMVEDMEMHLILGRLFLETSKALTDVQEGKLRLRVREKEITFDVFNALKHTLHTNDCFRVDSLDSLVCNFLMDAMKDPLKSTLTTEVKEDELDEEKDETVAYFNASHPRKKPMRMRLEDLGDKRED